MVSFRHLLYFWEVSAFRGNSLEDSWYFMIPRELWTNFAEKPFFFFMEQTLLERTNADKRFLFFKDDRNCRLQQLISGLLSPGLFLFIFWTPTERFSCHLKRSETECVYPIHEWNHKQIWTWSFNSETLLQPKRGSKVQKERRRRCRRRLATSWEIETKYYVGWALWYTMKHGQFTKAVFFLLS